MGPPDVELARASGLEVLRDNAQTLLADLVQFVVAHLLVVEPDVALLGREPALAVFSIPIGDELAVRRVHNEKLSTQLLVRHLEDPVEDVAPEQIRIVVGIVQGERRLQLSRSSAVHPNFAGPVALADHVDRLEADDVTTRELAC